MEFRNHTPFPALAFQMLDRDENEYHVVVMRATMDINNDGTLRFSEEQAPLAVTDEYFGEMNKSSVRQESDLAPFKPECDVIVNATAYAPGGKPAPSFEVGIRISLTCRICGRLLAPADFQVCDIRLISLLQGS